MKPDWLNDSQAAFTVATAEDNYIRRVEAPMLISREPWANETCFDATAISGQKDVSRIRQSFTLIVANITKWGLPKLGCRKAMNEGSEDPIWQRSSRSSRSVGKPRTWQRGAVDNFSINQKNT